MPLLNRHTIAPAAGALLLGAFAACDRHTMAPIDGRSMPAHETSARFSS